MNHEMTLRPEQLDILEYAGGKMGISAVPGSGKTFVLSLLATRIIQRGYLQDDQEVLIVTLVNSAVDNFYQRISEFIKSSNLLPNWGYRVRTLHGLAHDIVRERPELVGLDNNFIIVDERETGLMIDQAVQAWMRSNSERFATFLRDDLSEQDLTRISKNDIPELIKSIAISIIRFAKDQQRTPDQLYDKLEQIGMPLPLAEMGLAIYLDYQRGLAYRGGVDFDDLIRLALNILQNNEMVLDRLRLRWPYLLEDEAQDSSRLQEQILALLAGSSGNWVRVGDPNQAIYETFTTASPEYLIRFINDKFVVKKNLPVSGRSTNSIIELANYLVDWSTKEHPVHEVRNALIEDPKIRPTLPADPQPNPPDMPDSIFLVDTKYTADKEIEAVARSLKRWLEKNPASTVAVLAPRNSRALEMAAELERLTIPYNDDLLKLSRSTRSSAEVLEHVLDFLSDPKSSPKLAAVFQDFFRSKNTGDLNVQLMKKTAELIRKCRYLEEYLWPVPGRNWLDEILPTVDEAVLSELTFFRENARRWQESVLLPIDQIILSLAQDFFTESTELAIAHKIAVMLRSASDMHPTWRIFQFTQELRLITENKRRFLGFAEDGESFNPENYPGQVVLSTIHKAKGLEWDRVYLLSINNYDFPSGLTGDVYQPEKWFIRDYLNLEAEALDQIRLLAYPANDKWYEEGSASRSARLDYIRERLRLLYVGITRAKKELVITWNTGRRGDLTPAVPFIALQQFWIDMHGISNGVNDDT
jgi:DNA helicase II / ATP-dependent DNA helicase PcrA